VAKVNFLWNNLWRSGTIYDPSSEQVSFPAEASQHIWRTYPWRSGVASSDSEQYLCVDLLTAKTCTTIALLNHNFSPTAVITLKGSDSSTFTSSTDITLSYAAGNIFYVGSANTFRYWKVSVLDVDNTFGYIQIGYVMLGTPLEFSRDCSQGWSQRKVDPSTVIYSDGGVPSSLKRSKYVEVNLPFRYMTAADWALASAMFDSIGTTEGCLVLLDYANHLYDWTWYMNLSSLPEMPMNVMDFYEWTLSFRENL